MSQPSHPSSPRSPKYCRQRHRDGADRAFATIDGRRHYLGSYDSPESHQAYARLCAELAAGIRPGQHASGTTVAQLIDAYWHHAKQAYRDAQGDPSPHAKRIRHALRPALDLYGDTPADAFGPQAIRTIRERWIQQGLARKTINGYVQTIRKMFRWGVSYELVQPAVLQKLNAVEHLRRDRSPARETPPVRPVSDEQIEAVLPLVPAPVAALIRLQRLTGARPGELLPLRAVDLNTTANPWVFRPEKHKTSYRDGERVIHFGPIAQSILQPYMLTKPVGVPLFSPRDAARNRRRRRRTDATRSAQSDTPQKPSDGPTGSAQRRPGAHYDLASYRRAIHRACDEAFPPPALLARLKNETAAQHQERLTEAQWEELRQWQREHRWSPNQIRHTAATELAKAYGIETAKAVLGHRKFDTTRIYAERDFSKAAEAIQSIG